MPKPKYDPSKELPFDLDKVTLPQRLGIYFALVAHQQRYAIRNVARGLDSLYFNSMRWQPKVTMSRLDDFRRHHAAKLAKYRHWGHDELIAEVLSGVNFEEVPHTFRPVQQVEFTLAYEKARWHLITSFRKYKELSQDAAAHEADVDDSAIIDQEAADLAEDAAHA